MLTKNFEELKTRVEEHVKQRRVMQGIYWREGRGSFIGCLNHCDSTFPAADRYGLPEDLQWVAEDIFEELPIEEAKAFFAALPAAVGCNGKDLSLVNYLDMSKLGWSISEWNTQKEDLIDFYRRGRDLFLKLVTEAPVDA